MADTKVLEKVGKLIKLAQSADEEEARTAAMQATRLMTEHELVIVPKSEIERVQRLIGEQQTLAKQAKAESTKNMVIGGLIGLVVAKQGLL